MPATEKCHKRLASTSKGSSLIIQLPTTSANSQNDSSSIDHQNSISSILIDQNNNISDEFSIRRDEVILEQNNLFNNCSASRAQNRLRLAGSIALGSRADRHPQHQSHHYRHRQHNRLNNFHNHLNHQRHAATAANEQQFSERLMTQEGDLQTNETESEHESITPPPHYHEIPGVVPAHQGRSSGPPPAYDDVINPNAPPPSYQSLFGQMREARKTSNGLVDLFRQLFLVLIGTIGCTMIIGFLLLIPITMIIIGIVYVNDCRAENIPSFLVIGGCVWIMKNILNCYNQFKKDASTLNRPPPRRHQIQALPGTTRPSNSLLSSSSSSGVSSSNSSASVTIVSSTSATQTDSSSINSSETNNNHEFQNSSIASSSSTSSSSNDSQQQIEQVSTTSTQPMSTTIRRSTQQDSASNHIRHPPMIGLTSYKCESFLNGFLIVWFLACCIVVYRIYEPDYDNPASANYCNRLVYLYAFWLLTSAFIIMAIILSCLCCLMASSLMSCTHGR